MLITSRNPDWDELATPVRVDVFSRQESINLLRKWVTWLSELDANWVAEALEDLPLAIQQAAAFDQLAIDEPAALDLLTLAAHMVPEPIPFSLFTVHANLLPDPLAAAAGDPLMFADLTPTACNCTAWCKRSC